MGKTVNWQKYKAQIAQLSKLDFNYDAKVYHDSNDKSGWHIDRYEATLANEPIGEPLVGGAFEAAKSTIQQYRFADPRLIYAVFNPEDPLSGRNMLMFAKFVGFTFTFGVRVTNVIDELRTDSFGKSLRVWGYSYRTLKGHFEIGEIRFEVSKNLSNGEIRFEVEAYSKPDRIPNLFFRMGFKMFGRILQKYFASSSIKRLQAVAKEALDKKLSENSKDS